MYVYVPYAEKRRLSDGSLVTEFDTDGFIDSDTASQYAYDIAIDSTYMYIVGSNDSTNWRIEKRLLSDGSLVTEFDTDGVIDGDAASEYAEAVAIDSTYMYIAGSNDSTNWRIEKRFLSDGSLVTDGVVNSVTESKNVYDMVTDSTYMYIVGQNDSLNWRIEKRLLFDISLVDGVPSGSTGTLTDATPIAGKVGQALSFNGTTAGIDMGNVGAIEIKAVSFWIKADDITTRPVININSTDIIEIDGSSNIVATSFPASTVYIDASSASPTITTDWHHVVVNDTTGVLPTSFAIASSSPNFFEGALDEVRIYSRILTQKEINRLYRMVK